MSKSIYGRSTVNLTINNLEFLNIGVNDIVATNASITNLTAKNINLENVNISNLIVDNINISEGNALLINTSQLNASNSSIINGEITYLNSSEILTNVVHSLGNDLIISAKQNLLLQGYTGGGQGQNPNASIVVGNHQIDINAQDTIINGDITGPNASFTNINVSLIDLQNQIDNIDLTDFDLINVSKINISNASIDGLITGPNASFTNVNASLIDLQDQIDNINITDFSLINVSTLNSSTINTITINGQNFDNLVSQVSQNTTDISNNTTAISNLNTSISTLNTCVNTNTNNISTNTASINLILNEIQGIEGVLTGYENTGFTTAGYVYATNICASNNITATNEIKSDGLLLGSNIRSDNTYQLNVNGITKDIIYKDLSNNVIVSSNSVSSNNCSINLGIFSTVNSNTINVSTLNASISYVDTTIHQQHNAIDLNVSDLHASICRIDGNCSIYGDLQTNNINTVTGSTLNCNSIYLNNVSKIRLQNNEVGNLTNEGDIIYDRANTYGNGTSSGLFYKNQTTSYHIYDSGNFFLDTAVVTSIMTPLSNNTTDIANNATAISNNTTAIATNTGAITTINNTLTNYNTSFTTTLLNTNTLNVSSLNSSNATIINFNSSFSNVSTLSTSQHNSSSINTSTITANEMNVGTLNVSTKYASSIVTDNLTSTNISVNNLSVITDLTSPDGHITAFSSSQINASKIVLPLLAGQAGEVQFGTSALLYHFNGNMITSSVDGIKLQAYYAGANAHVLALDNGFAEFRDSQYVKIRDGYLDMNFNNINNVSNLNVSNIILPTRVPSTQEGMLRVGTSVIYDSGFNTNYIHDQAINLVAFNNGTSQRCTMYMSANSVVFTDSSITIRDNNLNMNNNNIVNVSNISVNSGGSIEFGSDGIIGESGGQVILSNTNGSLLLSSYSTTPSQSALITMGDQIIELSNCSLVVGDDKIYEKKLPMNFMQSFFYDDPPLEGIGWGQGNNISWGGVLPSGLSTNSIRGTQTPITASNAGRLEFNVNNSDYYGWWKVDYTIEIQNTGSTRANFRVSLFNASIGPTCWSRSTQYARLDEGEVCTLRGYDCFNISSLTDYIYFLTYVDLGPNNGFTEITTTYDIVGIGVNFTWLGND